MKSPLVYASRRALREAASILADGQVLETTVARLITEGRVSFARGYGEVRGENWTASVRRIAPRLRTRRRPRPWLVIAVETASDEPVSTDKEAHDG